MNQQLPKVLALFSFARVPWPSGPVKRPMRCPNCPGRRQSVGNQNRIKAGFPPTHGGNGRRQNPAAPCELRVDKLKVSDSLEKPQSQTPAHCLEHSFVCCSASVRKSETRLQALNTYFSAPTLRRLTAVFLLQLTGPALSDSRASTGTLPAAACSCWP